MKQENKSHAFCILTINTLVILTISGWRVNLQNLNSLSLLAGDLIQNSLKVTAIALVLGIISVFASTATSHTDDIIVELQVQNGHFQRANLIVKANTPFKLKVTNTDKSPIEFESFSLNREREVAPGQTVTVYLPALAPGTYEFFDDFHKNNKGTITAR